MVAVDYDKANREAQDERAREEGLQKRRAELRDMQWLSQPDSPANRSAPTFLIGPAKDFPHIAAGRPDPALGHMSPDAHNRFMAAMTDAAKAETPQLRDQATARAAQEVAQDMSRHNQHSPAKTNQAGFSVMELREGLRNNIQDLGREAGLSPVASQALGFSLQRALEREGIKTMVNHAVDGVGRWQASAATAATQLGQRYNLEKATKFLADHGMSSDNIKAFAGRHAGKASTLLTAAEHRSELMTAMSILKESGVTVQGMARLAGDKEVRHAVGDMAMGGGAVASSMPGLKAAGSIAILAGALMKGESTEEMGKHAVRALGAIAGGALGSVGGVFGTVVGAEAGHMAADKLVSFYEERFEKDRGQPQPVASREEGLGRMQAGARTFANNEAVQDMTRGGAERLEEGVKARLASLTPGSELDRAPERSQDRGREMEMTREMRPGGGSA